MTRLPPKFALPDPIAELAGGSYEALLGPAAWLRLSPPIRARFCREAAHRPVTYRGVMRRVELSFAGQLLAQLCRLIGTPLALYPDRDVTTVVRVYPDPKQPGMVWDRSYEYVNRPMCRVRSTKTIDAKDGLLELVGGGFGMYLQLSEAAGAMHFTSTRFFWKVARWRVPIPLLLTPGVTRVSQTDLGGDEFQFELRVTHPWLGRTYYQVGTFRAIADSRLSS